MQRREHTRPPAPRLDTGANVLALGTRRIVGGQNLSNPLRIAVVIVCIITLFYLVVTLAQSVSEGG